MDVGYINLLDKDHLVQDIYTFSFISQWSLNAKTSLEFLIRSAARAPVYIGLTNQIYSGAVVGLVDHVWSGVTSFRPEFSVQCHGWWWCNGPHITHCCCCPQHQQHQQHWVLWLVATATSHCITVTTPTNINSKRLGDYQLFFEGKCQLNLKICCHQSKTKNF